MDNLAVQIPNSLYILPGASTVAASCSAPADEGGASERCQNTDPFVFGDRFHYALCQQRSRVGYTQMRHLAPGSVVLFGSRIGKRFALDTVLVVGDAVEFTRPDHRATLRGRISRVYEDVTMNHIGPGTFNLYSGATPDEPVDGMFSFFPCLPYTEGSSGFPRPIISIPGIIADRQTQGRRQNAGMSAGQVRMNWDEVVRQVEAQGLRLGVHAGLPERRRRASGSSA